MLPVKEKIKDAVPAQIKPNSPDSKQSEAAFSLWELFDGMINKRSLDLVPTMATVPSSDTFGQAMNTVRVDQVTRIVYDKKENNLVKFNSLFSAVNAANSAVFILLYNSGAKTEIYLGTNALAASEASTGISTLEGALQGNFPGIVTQAISQDDLTALSEKLRTGNCINCVTGIPSQKNSDDIPFSQGLEKIIEAMGDRPYTALLLATPVSSQQLTEAEQAYQDLYSQLSLMNLNQLSLNQQESIALGKSIGQSFSTALSTNISKTNTTTHTDSSSQTNTKSVSNANSQTASRNVTDGTSHTDSTNTSHTSSTNRSTTRNFGGIASTGAGIIGGAIGFFAGGPVGMAIGASIGGIAGSLVGSRSKGTSESDTTGTSTSDTTSHSVTMGEAETNTKTVSESNGISNGTSDAYGNSIQRGHGKTKTETSSEQDSTTETALKGISYNYAVVEKRIVEAQKILDEQLLRLRQAKNYGGWNWAAYFIGNTSNDTNMAANIFAGILRGEQSGVEHSAILHWDSRNPSFSSIKDELAKFRHPLFLNSNNQPFSPTSLLSTREIAVGMTLPQKSLPGLPVFSAAEFGRSVVPMSQTEPPKRIFHLGHVVHLDKEYEHEAVDLDIDSLSSHMFVTGSTGSGKSNAIYCLLKRLREEKIPFLVIEPAKGEYKTVFGGLRNVSVYGTNPYQTDLFRINPFSFPEEIHIVEHIDRLIEILNAAWPMYSAMPAILKKAIEKAYESCGWNLLTSRNAYTPAIYPDFTNLLEVLPVIIEKTDYSAEVMGNYKGALIERVSSLTNGYYRSIFQKNELPPEQLFDKSVIIDISRVGSAETKALLMGVLFQKLQEYRIAKATEANTALKHITILEEAHHLLRRTSLEQSGESANLQGKAIEMLTNGIAEMRTYGEGFVIADQAPGLLDQAVIRNTNTKIVFNLPAQNDRELAGKAQGLTAEQVDDIAHLRRGHAIVYQNHWQEAVQCKITRFDATQMTNMGTVPEFHFDTPTSEELEQDSRTIADIQLMETLLTKLQNETYQPPTAVLERIQQYKPDVVEIIQTGSYSKICCFLNEWLLKEKIASTPKSTSMGQWTTDLLQSVFKDSRTSHLSDELKDILLKTIFQILAESDKHPAQKEKWLLESKNTSKWRIWQ